MGPDVWSYRWWESGPNGNIRLPETADGQRCGITSDLQPEFKGRQIDWHIGDDRRSDIRQFTSAPCFHLLSHRLKVSLIRSTPTELWNGCYGMDLT
jgi:hypothetical protein